MDLSPLRVLKSEGQPLRSTPLGPVTVRIHQLHSRLTQVTEKRLRGRGTPLGKVSAATRYITRPGAKPILVRSASLDAYDDPGLLRVELVRRARTHLKRRKNASAMLGFTLSMPNEFAADDGALAAEAARRLVDWLSVGGRGTVLVAIHRNEPGNWHLHGQAIDDAIETAAEARTRKEHEGGERARPRELMRLTRVGLADELRAQWAAICNEIAVNSLFDVHVEHRSFADQGLKAVARERVSVVEHKRVRQDALSPADYAELEIRRGFNGKVEQGRASGEHVTPDLADDPVYRHRLAKHAEQMAFDALKAARAAGDASAIAAAEERHRAAKGAELEARAAKKGAKSQPPAPTLPAPVIPEPVPPPEPTIPPQPVQPQLGNEREPLPAVVPPRGKEKEKPPAAPPLPDGVSIALLLRLAQRFADQDERERAAKEKARRLAELRALDPSVLRLGLQVLDKTDAQLRAAVYVQAAKVNELATQLEKTWRLRVFRRRRLATQLALAQAEFERKRRDADAATRDHEIQRQHYASKLAALAAAPELERELRALRHLIEHPDGGRPPRVSRPSPDVERRIWETHRAVAQLHARDTRRREPRPLADRLRSQPLPPTPTRDHRQITRQLPPTVRRAEQSRGDAR